MRLGNDHQREERYISTGRYQELAHHDAPRTGTLPSKLYPPQSRYPRDLSMVHLNRTRPLQDLEPNDMLIGKDGQLRQADFGLAREFGEYVDVAQDVTM